MTYLLFVPAFVVVFLCLVDSCLKARAFLGKSLRDRAFALRAEPLRVSSVPASIAFAGDAP